MTDVSILQRGAAAVAFRVAARTAVALFISWMLPATAEIQALDEHFQAARVALNRGDTDKAERELKLSLQDNPLDAEAHLLLGSLLGREGDLDQAMVGFQRAMTLEPSSAVARYNLGTALLWRGDPVPAARLLEEAVVIRPDYVPAYNNLGKAYFLAGIPELAVASYQEALRHDPSNAIALQNFALLTDIAGVQAPGPGSSADAGEPKKPISATPPVAAQGEETRPSTLAAAPATSDPQPGVEEGADVVALRELVRDLPHVTVERRGGRLTVAGWTSGPNERTLLDRVLAVQSDVLDLTGEDVGDPTDSSR